MIRNMYLGDIQVKTFIFVAITLNNIFFHTFISNCSHKMILDKIKSMYLCRKELQNMSDFLFIKTKTFLNCQAHNMLSEINFLK